MSHPTRVRGLKLKIIKGADTTRKASHPTRVRGLKREGYLEILSKYMSHPTRVRGLKQLTAVQLENPMKVPPESGGTLFSDTRGQFEPDFPSLTNYPPE